MSNWPDEARRIAKAHTDKQTIYGIAPSNRPLGDKEGWSIRDTAKDLGMAKTTVATYLLLARLLERDPSVEGKILQVSKAVEIARILVKDGTQT